MSNNKSDNKQLKDLYIEDLGQVTGGGKGNGKPRPTTKRLGEEDMMTTLAIGEEDDATTLAIGEEDMATTLAIGEEDDGTTL